MIPGLLCIGLFSERTLTKEKHIFELNFEALEILDLGE
jgi:hypothetical protein